MSKRRARFVALAALLQRRDPGLEDPEALILAQAVVVDGRTVANPAAMVRADASVRVLSARRLRGAVKLSAALSHFEIDVGGLVAVDVGAAAGGFTSALLEAGAGRVYAVDAGHGQLKPALRRDPRVVNLEGVNLGVLDVAVVPEVVDLVVMDLSYLAVADALPQLLALRLAPDAGLVALVKPTYELHERALARRPEQVAAAVQSARRSAEACGWSCVGEVLSPIEGARGAVEAFLHARRTVLSSSPH